MRATVFASSRRFAQGRVRRLEALFLVLRRLVDVDFSLFGIDAGGVDLVRTGRGLLQSTMWFSGLTIELSFSAGSQVRSASPPVDEVMCREPTAGASFPSMRSGAPLLLPRGMTETVMLSYAP